MTVRTEQHAGKARLVIDILYTDARTGRRARYRRDAEVQTKAAAAAEERRLWAEIAQKGYLERPGGPARAPRGAPPAAGPAPKAEAPAEPFTFGDALKLFRATKAVTGIKATTLRGYEVTFKAYLEPRFGRLAASAVDHAAVGELDADLVKAGLSPAARGNVQIALRSVLRCAVEAKKLAAMPDLPELPKAGKKVVRPPSREDVELVLSKAGPAARRALLIAADAGLRAGEIRGLRWCDVDLDKGALYVRQTIYRGKADTPKSGHEREVPLTPRLAAELGRARDPDVPGEAPVAPTSHGKVWGEFGLRQAFARAVRRTGLPKARLHDLRHFFVTQCFAVGGDAPTVRELAGHADLATTQRYAHTAAERKHDLVRRLAS